MNFHITTIPTFGSHRFPITSVSVSNVQAVNSVFFLIRWRRRKSIRRNARAYGILQNTALLRSVQLQLSPLHNCIRCQPCAVDDRQLVIYSSSKIVKNSRAQPCEVHGPNPCCMAVLLVYCLTPKIVFWSCADWLNILWIQRVAIQTSFIWWYAYESPLAVDVGREERRFRFSLFPAAYRRGKIPDLRLKLHAFSSTTRTAVIQSIESTITSGNGIKYSLRAAAPANTGPANEVQHAVPQTGNPGDGQPPAFREKGDNNTGND